MPLLPTLSSSLAAVPGPGAQDGVDPGAALEKVEQAVEAAGSGGEPAAPRADGTLDSALETVKEAIGGLVEDFLDHLPQIVIAVVVLVLAAFASRILRKLARRLTGRMGVRPSLRDLVGQLTSVGVWFVGLLIAMGIVFPGFGVAEIVATAGLMSIALGFAFQDIFENFFAGILILWRFPFEPGDYIEIASEDIVGRVEDIWIRLTLLRLTTGELVTVPNSTVYKSPIRVLTDRDHRRLTVACGVAYGEDVGEARKVIRAAVESCETVRAQPEVEIFLTGFGASSMDFEVTWWTGPTPVEHRRSRDEVVEAVKRALDEAGIEIPYPYRVLTFTRNEPLIYEQLARAGVADRDADEPRAGDTNGHRPSERPVGPGPRDPGPG